VIGPEGEQLGKMSPSRGMEIAKEAGLDLVEVSPNSRPPVCKIMDFGRYQYEQSKKSRQQKKQSASEMKEMRFRPKIEEHDYNFKLNHIRQFLEDGHKVRAFVIFRGREMTRTEMGRDLLDKVVEELAENAKPEGEPRLEGRNMSVLLTPVSKKRRAKPKPKQKKEGALAEALKEALPEQTAEAEPEKQGEDDADDKEED
jgi:translation initiation factor IF-3